MHTGHRPTLHRSLKGFEIDKFIALLHRHGLWGSGLRGVSLWSGGLWSSGCERRYFWVDGDSEIFSRKLFFCGVEGILTHEGILAHAKEYAGILALFSKKKQMKILHSTEPSTDSDGKIESRASCSLNQHQ